LKRSIFIFSLVLGFCWSCNEGKIASPKPYSYPRIEFPEKSYRPFSQPFCLVAFEGPTITEFNRKRQFFNEDPANECWFNLLYDDLNATLYFTSHDIDRNQTLDKLVDDAYLMASKHNDKANSRQESFIENRHGLKGVIFEIGGPVASPLQFYLTDGTHNFIRGSLYYNSGAANDSLAMVTDYIKEDIDHIVGTARFH